MNSSVNPSKYVVKTLGCKANLYDSQLIEAELQKRGWKPAVDLNEDGVDLCIVNSCTVTDEADRQSRKMAARLNRDNPGARVVITGCSAEVDPERLASSKGVDYVVGNRDKPGLVDLVLEKMALGLKDPAADGEILGVAKGYNEMTSRHPMDREWPETESSFSTDLAEESASHRTRAFLKIQDGCNSFCTYCVIPYGRGPSRSLQIADVVKQVQTQVSRGVQEVVITGINIGDYGTDWADSFKLDELFAAIFNDTDLKRLRVSSLDPTEITEGMMRLVESQPRFAPHFHVSLQSPHSRILRLMKRKYAADHVNDCLKRLGSLVAPAGGVFVGMDLITGFPGESAEEFDWGVQRLSELYWSRLHVFPYSERSGTPATRLGGAVPQAERVRRARILRELSLERLKSVYRGALATLKESGRPLTSVLIEGSVRGPDGTQNWLSGYSSNYLRTLVRVEPGKAALYENRILENLYPFEIIVDSDSGDAAFLSSIS